MPLWLGRQHLYRKKQVIPRVGEVGIWVGDAISSASLPLILLSKAVTLHAMEALEGRGV
jgi:hypothetical protein